MRNPQHKLGIPIVQLSLENPHLQRKKFQVGTLDPYIFSLSRLLVSLGRTINCTVPNNAPNSHRGQYGQYPQVPNRQYPCVKKKREKTDDIYLVAWKLAYK